jgi:hypothetical protein
LLPRLQAKRIGLADACGVPAMSAIVRPRIAGAFRSPRLDRLSVLGGLMAMTFRTSRQVSIRRLVCATSLSGRTLPLAGYAKI